MKKLILGLMFVAAPVMAQDRVTQYDFDQDGRVSFEDLNRFCSVSENLFTKADKNNDGYLTNSEMRTAKAYLFARCEKVEKA